MSAMNPAPSYGYGGIATSQRPLMRSAQPQVQQNKSRRLYVGNIPYHVGITENGMVQLFSALFVAGFRPLSPGEPLPVTSFWLHSDGKFGFMELRGDQEAVDCMQFNGLILHGRPLRVNRPSDFRPDLNLQLTATPINVNGVIELCNQLTGLVAPPASIASAAQVAPAPPLRSAAVQPANETNGVTHSAPHHAQGQAAANSSAPELESTRSASAAPPPPMLRSQPAAPSVSGPESSEAQPPPSSSDASGERASGALGSPVTVLALDHIVQNEDLDTESLYEELLQDVQQECETYGKVLEVSIPKTGPGRGTAFVAYGTKAEADKAIIGLAERVFENQAITGVIVPNQTSAKEAADNYQPIRAN